MKSQGTRIQCLQLPVSKQGNYLHKYQYNLCTNSLFVNIKAGQLRGICCPDHICICGDIPVITYHLRMQEKPESS